MAWIRAIDRLPGYHVPGRELISQVRVKFEDGDTEWLCDPQELINELNDIEAKWRFQLLWWDDSPNPLLEEIKQLRSFFKKGSPLTEMMDKIIKKYEGVGDN